MKRALAERAKQSGLPNGLVTDSPGPTEPLPLTKSSSGSTDSVLEGTNGNGITIPHADAIPTVEKPSQVTPSLQAQESEKSQQPIERIKVEIPKPPSSSRLLSNSSNVTAPGRSPRAPPSLSPRPKKRLREFGNNSSSSSNLKLLEEEDQEDPNSSAFFLKHQNRALASELRSVKYQLVRLERERDHRRAQCLEALESLNSLQSIWTQLESSLGHVSEEGPDTTASGDPMFAAKETSADWEAPVSTGSGTSVEMIGALLNSLSRLRTTKKKSRIKIEDGEGDSVGCRECACDEVKGNGNASLQRDTNRMDMDDEVTNKDDNTDEPVNGVASIKEELNHDDAEEHKQTASQIEEFSADISQRAAALQSWILSLLQRIEQSQSDPVGENTFPPQPTYAELRDEVTQLHSRNSSLQEQLDELARSRDEMVESDRRVRRGLYRLAAGRVQLKEVLKAVASADEDKEEAAAWMEVATPAPLNSIGISLHGQGENVKSEVSLQTTNKSPTPISEEASLLKRQIADLNEVASSRDEQIKKLLAEREEQLKRISALVLKEDKESSDVPTNQEVQRSDLYLELTSKLAAHERKLEEVEEKSIRIKEEWSTARANAELSKKAMEDMQSRHLKRWAELVEEHPDIGPAEDGGDSTPSGRTKAEEIVTLQHKLTQALENVRQAESTRKTLDEAIALNESLQAKVEEFKSKYNALQAEKASRAGTGTGGSSNNNSTKISSSTENVASSAEGVTPKGKAPSLTMPAPSSSTPSEKIDRSAEKLHRDYKRARKELAAATASKEAAKAKLDRTEKDRDFLNQMNSRLLKQAAEKDEINAKSLSTILHLKQLTEQISREKENLEQQVKSAEQLSLAARLASNARDRITEEYEKERAGLETQVKEWEHKCDALAREKELAEGRLLQERAKISGLISDAQKAKERCDELASESTKLQEEKQRMVETLAVAQREASDAASLSQKLAQSSGVGLVGGFTADQLSTQVSVLKSRLACPVCNARDKKCILLRCRHMFCKNCVDENIKNRSRKCPACGSRFDTKDVADVWL